MYLNIKKLLNISPYNIGFYKDNIFLVNKKSKEIFCISANDFYTKWEISKENYGFITLGDKIISHNFFIYDFNGNLVYENTNINKWYNLELFEDKYGLVVYKTVDEENEKAFYHIFNVHNKILIKQNIDFFAPKLFISKSVLFCQEEKHKIYVYNYDIQKILWQKDIREIASYTDWDGKHQGNIKNVYLFEDKLIVTAGGSVLALNIENGEILWQVKYTDFQPLTLHINGKYAYLARGVFYSVIDLEKGEKLLETMLIRPFDHDKKYEKANLAMVGSDMTFYDNYLYFSDKHKGQYYLAKLNPQTGKIEDFQFLEGITSNLHPPKFYENKMFLQDNENNLFIYERDKI